MKWIKKRDIVIMMGILIIAAGVYFSYNQYVKQKPAKAEIYYKSQLIKTVFLNTGKEEIFTLPQAEQVTFHLYKEGAIAFESSNCPDKVCVKSGKLRWVGQSAACLPNKIILKIVPQERGKEDVDMIG
ncbi:MAG: NusG domain II-containing protein [Acetivibrio sp.]